jgi:ppGpp synthetase/RelA/SpoT-type nucleotidyltranferase
MSEDNGKSEGEVKEWHREQVLLYTQEFEHYKIYADILRSVLETACEIDAPLAIVQARPKTISSFAEKVIRKKDKYNNPVQQLTDLCGARVITHTQDQVKEVCRFIEKKFEVDWENSLDVSTRLKSNEFGYLSVHYIVTITQESIMGIKIPLDQIGGKKAEIQVRTLLQHTWSDILHDRVYKSTFKVPVKFKRESARLAATMEAADKEFQEFTQDYERYKRNYSAHMCREEREKEIDTLKLILDNEPTEKSKQALALQIANIAKLSGDWALIKEILAPHIEGIVTRNRYLADYIAIEYGYACCRLTQKDVGQDEYSKGQEILRRVACIDPDSTSIQAELTPNETKIRSKALRLLAWTHLNDRTGGDKAFYDQALELDSGNPYILADCLKYHLSDLGSVNLIKQSIKNGIETCRSHIEMGVELPNAFFTIGRLYFTLKEFYKSLEAYLEAIQYCSIQEESFYVELLEEEIQFIRNSGFEDSLRDRCDWLIKTLLLGKAVIVKDKLAAKTLERTSIKRNLEKPALIIAGGTTKDVQKEVERYRPYISTALRGYTGSIISGGTKSGVCGMLGDVVKSQNEGKFADIQLCGYTYKNTDPYSVHEAYTLVERPDDSYSPGQAVQYWVDILASGIDTKDVKLVGINGGEIAAIEYRMALALGAKVFIFGSSGRAASEIIRDSRFNENKNLINVPDDQYSLRSLLMDRKSSLTKEQLEEAAKQIHLNYMESVKPTDPSLMPWDKLDESLKHSNRDQATFCEEILKSCGYEVRAVQNSATMPDFTLEEVERMAEMEHGRWNAERLLRGWRYGKEKDIPKKVSPWLIAWSEMPEEIKKFDRVAILNYCKLLEKAGLEVYKA